MYFGLNFPGDLAKGRGGAKAPLDLWLRHLTYNRKRLKRIFYCWLQQFLS